MDEFPFSEADWNSVRETSSALVDATLADDEIAWQSLFRKLQLILCELAARYGNHPVLLETEADFEADPLRRDHLYRECISLADAYGIPSDWARISYARLLLEEFRNCQAALSQLLLCRTGVDSSGVRIEMKEWQDLFVECNRREKQRESREKGGAAH